MVGEEGRGRAGGASGQRKTPRAGASKCLGEKGCRSGAKMPGWEYRQRGWVDAMGALPSCVPQPAGSGAAGAGGCQP